MGVRSLVCSVLKENWRHSAAILILYFCHWSHDSVNQFHEGLLFEILSIVDYIFHIDCSVYSIYSTYLVSCATCCNGCRTDIAWSRDHARPSLSSGFGELFFRLKVECLELCCGLGIVSFQRKNVFSETFPWAHAQRSRFAIISSNSADSQPADVSNSSASCILHMRTSNQQILSWDLNSYFELSETRTKTFPPKHKTICWPEIGLILLLISALSDSTFAQWTI